MNRRDFIIGTSILGAVRMVEAGVDENKITLQDIWLLSDESIRSMLTPFYVVHANAFGFKSYAIRATPIDSIERDDRRVVITHVPWTCCIDGLYIGQIGYLDPRNHVVGYASTGGQILYAGDEMAVKYTFERHS